MKKRMSKRFLSMLLAVVMVVSMLPVTAFAAGSATEEHAHWHELAYDEDFVVNMGFGQQLNPNGLFAEQYDITAVGAVKLDKNDGLRAKGEAELNLPIEVLEGLITERVYNEISVYIAPVSQYYTSSVEAMVAEKRSSISLGESLTISGVTVNNPTITLPSEMTLAGIFEHAAKNGNVTVAGTVTTLYGELPQQIDNVKFWTVLQVDIAPLAVAAVATKAAEWLDVELYAEPSDNTDPNYISFVQWAMCYGASSFDTEVLARKFAAVCAYLKAKALIASGKVELPNGTIYNVPSVLQPFLGQQNIYKSATGTYAYEYKAEAEFAKSFENELKAYADTLIYNDNSDDVDSLGLLPTIKASGFYGKLKPFTANLWTGEEVLSGDCLTKRFEILSRILDTFVGKFSALGVDTTDMNFSDMFSSITFIEGILKSSVAKINNEEEADVPIYGGIYGLEGESLTSPQTQTGIYFVVGVNSANLADRDFGIYVIAPEIVRGVSIQKDGVADSNKLMTATVGDPYEITATVTDDNTEDTYVPTVDNLMNLRITGLSTGGEAYDTDKFKTSTKTTVDEPTNAGVYTVLSLYLDDETLAMGGDIAVLVVEPAETEKDALKFTTNKAELVVPYDGKEHYPSLTSKPKDKDGNTHAVIKGAVNKDQKAAYVVLDGIDIESNVTNLEEDAKIILDTLNAKTEGLNLPINGLTTYAMIAVERMASYAINKAGEGADGGILKGSEVNAYLAKFLTKLGEYYSYENVKKMAVPVYNAAETAIIKANNTVNAYAAMIDSTIEELKAALAGGTTYSLRSTAVNPAAATTAQKFLDIFMEEANVSREQVMGMVEQAVHYAKGYVENPKYLNDAITLVETVGSLAGASQNDMDIAEGAVYAKYTALKENVKKSIVTYTGVTSIDDVDTKTEIEAVIANMDMTTAKELAKAVLVDVETFVKDTVAIAQTFVDDTNWAINTVYFNIEPSEVGVYDCYAVNVNPNYVPNLTKTTLEILETVTITANEQNVRSGSEFDAEDYTVTSTVTEGKEITDAAFNVTLTVYDGETEVTDLADLEPGEYTIKVTVAEKTDGKYALDATTPTVDGKLTITEKEHEHSYTTVVTAPTCTEQGYTTYTCSDPDCGESYVGDYVDALGHTEGEAVKENETAATCTTAGYFEEVVYCTVESCKAELSRVSMTTGKKPHTVVVDAAKEATCAVTGLTEGSHCSVCNEVLVAQEVTPTLDHSPSEVKIENNQGADCYNAAYYEEVVYCLGCGKELSREEVYGEKLHNPGQVDVVDEIRETCTEPGSYVEVTYCSECEQEISRETIVILAAHDWDWDNSVFTSATCTTPWTRTAECKRDGCFETKTETGTVDENAHAWDEGVVFVPTCTKGGYTMHTCEYDPEHVSYTNSVDALGHDYQNYLVVLEPTCTATGVKTGTCTVCGGTDSIKIPATGHVDEKVNETGESGADGICDVCQYAATGCGGNHTEPNAFEKENVIPATCEADGSYDSVKYCTKCGDELIRITNVLPQLACEDKLINETEAEGQDGLCDNCGREMCTLEKGHPWIIREAEAPTCDKPGLDQGTYCPVCDQVLEVQEVLDPIGHDWDEENPEVISESTCTSRGETRYTCLNDASHKKSVWADLLEHVDSEPDGYCDVCGYKIPCYHENKNAVRNENKDTEADCTHPARAAYDLYCADCGIFVQTRWEDIAGSSELGHLDENGDFYCERVCNGNVCNHYPVCDHSAGYTFKGQVKPTCTNDGYDCYVCKICNVDERHTDFVNSLGHLTDGIYHVNSTTHYEQCARPGCGHIYNSHQHNFMPDSKTTNEWFCATSEDGKNVGCGYRKKVAAAEFKAEQHIPAVEAYKDFTVEQFKNVMIELSDNKSVTDSNSVLKNLEFTYEGDSTKTYNVVEDEGDIDHFAGVSGNIAVKIAIPEEFPEVVRNNPDKYNFYVTHMFAEGLNDKTVGDVENPTVKVVDGMLSFEVEGLSPGLVAYEEKATQPELFSFFGTNVNLGNNLDMQFAFAQSAITDWTGHYVKMVRTYSEDENGVIKADDVVTVPYSDWVKNGSYYVVTYGGLAAKEMCDEITVTVYNAAGQAVSKDYKDSMRAYAMRKYNGAPTVFTDMLNYGAAAQEHFTYGVDDLANSKLTEAQKQNASTLQTITNGLKADDTKFYGSNLTVKSNIQFSFAFLNITDDMYATATFTGWKGNNETVNIPAGGFTKNGSYYTFTLENMVVADARCEIDITVYNGDGTVYTTVKESIESYIARNINKAEVFGEFMEFADTAHEYLRNKQ